MTDKKKSMQKKNNAPDIPNVTDNKNMFITPDQNNMQYHRYEEMPYNDYYQENIPENYRFNEQYQPDYRYNYPGIEYEYDRKENDKESTSSEEEKSKKNWKKKIIMEYIEGKNKRSVTFSKRKKGIMKKAYELNVLTGTQILLLVASESGHVYTFATPKLKPIISNHERLIQQCLNAPTSPQERNQVPQPYNKVNKEDDKKDKFYDGFNNGYYNGYDNQEK